MVAVCKDRRRHVQKRFGGMAVLHQFFAYSVKALTGADFLPLPKPLGPFNLNSGYSGVDYPNA